MSTCTALPQKIRRWARQWQEAEAAAAGVETEAAATHRTVGEPTSFSRKVHPAFRNIRSVNHSGCTREGPPTNSHGNCG